jgi:serine/threonine protein kinase
VNLEDEKPFYVMPLASGSLRQLLPLYPGGMPEDLAVTMFFSILDAVQFAHTQGVLHRDIKPENVLIFDDEPVIADFGLGLRLQSGSTTITVAHVGLGTIQYSAPPPPARRSADPQGLSPQFSTSDANAWRNSWKRCGKSVSSAAGSRAAG